LTCSYRRHDYYGRLNSIFPCVPVLAETGTKFLSSNAQFITDASVATIVTDIV